MTSLNDTINSIKNTNTKIIVLTKNIEDDVNKIIISTQIDLITSISIDYNINLKELTKKYITKNKKNRKKLDIDNTIINDTYLDQQYLDNYQQKINQVQIQDQDNESNLISNINISDLSTLIKKPRKIRIKKSDKLNNSNNINDNIKIKSSKQNKLNKLNKSDEQLNLQLNLQLDNNVIIFKPIKIKDITYLLNPYTNELFDMDNNLVGKKQNDKYLLKNRS